MDIKDLKILTEDNESYIVINSLVISDQTYALINNIDDEADSKFVKIKESENGLAVEEIDDGNIIDMICNKIKNEE